VGKLALTTGKKQKRKVATSEQAYFLIVLKRPPQGSCALAHNPNKIKKQKRCNAALLFDCFEATSPRFMRFSA
jgi:hypothetical protein